MSKPKILLIIPRGEAVRNFIYSETIDELSKSSEVSILSVIDKSFYPERKQKLVQEFYDLPECNESKIISILRLIIHWAHFRNQWTITAKNHWDIHNARATSIIQKVKREIVKVLAILFSSHRSLHILTKLENYLTWILRPKNIFEDIYKKLRPDFVFNCSHIHGKRGELPITIAKFMGFKTGCFIFSWDNLTTRSRIFPPYDYYFVWHKKMNLQLLSIYPYIRKSQVIVTGTPQFDFHFDHKYKLSKIELFKKLKISLDRPIILYTTGMASHFPEEHLILHRLIEYVRSMQFEPKPVLVIRPYIKDTSDELNSLRKQEDEDVKFVDMLWDKEWITPLEEDLTIYSNLIRHCTIGINAASTVSLELCMFDKPVINIYFDPPGSNLPEYLKWKRHIEFDHYLPIVESGAVKVAKDIEELFAYVNLYIDDQSIDRENRKILINDFFSGELPGGSALTFSKELLQLSME